MRAAGRVVAEMHRPSAPLPNLESRRCTSIVSPATCSPNAGATSNFLGYHGYPAVICASVNDEIVHGIPNERAAATTATSLSIDCGAIVNGWHGDAAFTMGVGTIDAAAQRLIDAADRALGRCGRSDASRWASRRCRRRRRSGGQRRRVRQPARLLRPRNRSGDARGTRCREPWTARQGSSAGTWRGAGDRADVDRRRKRRRDGARRRLDRGHRRRIAGRAHRAHRVVTDHGPEILTRL